MTDKVAKARQTREANKRTKQLLDDKAFWKDRLRFWFELRHDGPDEKRCVRRSLIQYRKCLKRLAKNLEEMYGRSK